MENNTQSNQDISYYYWLNQKNNISSALNSLFNYDDLIISNLKKNYSRQLVIFDEIIEESSIQLDDPQYCETTSWKYEDELNLLYKEVEHLAPKAEQIIEKIEHQNLLTDLGMTEEQYKQHCLEVNQFKRQKNRNNKF